jgi:cyanophycinase
MANGDLFIIGGNEDKKKQKELLSKFVELSGTREGKIGILTTATNYPLEVGEEYCELFRELGAADCVHFHIDSRELAEGTAFTDQLKEISSLFITGGDQVRLTSILGGTKFYNRLHKCWKRGMLIGGTSAGAAVMSRLMIMSSKTLGENEQIFIEMGSGFGFLEDVIIDQHFSQRARFTRLMNAIAHNPQIIGIGIDENTAIWVKERGDIFEVLGEHTVTVFDGKKLSYVDVAMANDNNDITISGVRLHTLARGYVFDLINRELIIETGRDNDEN